jgi:formiminoglutamase
VINLDPHLDLRPYPQGAHSGSPFLQIADWQHSQNETFKYLCIGTRDYANTPALWMKARELGVEIIDGSLCNWRHINQVEAKIRRFIEGVDHYLLSIDMDGFNAAAAPGVSAPAHLGYEPAFIETLLPCLVEPGKMAGLDIAETNPLFDQDQRTARLSATLMYRILHLLSSLNQSRFSMTVF